MDDQKTPMDESHEIVLTSTQRENRSLAVLIISTTLVAGGLIGLTYVWESAIPAAVAIAFLLGFVIVCMRRERRDLGRPPEITPEPYPPPPPLPVLVVHP